MYKQLIINVTEHETRVALLEDGTIAELYVDRGDDSNIAPIYIKLGNGSIL